MLRIIILFILYTTLCNAQEEEQQPTTSTTTNTDISKPSQASFNDAPYGSKCAVCEDIATTWSTMYPCKSEDPASLKATDCGFQCSMLCKPGESSCKRSQMCERAYNAIANNSLVAKYFWETGMCSDYNEYDQCMMAPIEVTKAIGGLKCFTDKESGTFDHDTLVISNPECMQDPMCRAAQPNEGENLQSVRDECMVCVWVAKTFPLFREICKPTNVEYDCNTIVNQYGKPYRPEDDPTNTNSNAFGDGAMEMAALKTAASNSNKLRRRRRLKANIVSKETNQILPAIQKKVTRLKEKFISKIFKPTDKHGIGSPAFSNTEIREKPLLKQCLQAWYRFANSKFAQAMVQCSEPVSPSEESLKTNPTGASATDQCRCMCSCPYTEKDWLKLSSTCEYKPQECQLPNVTPEMEKAGDPYQQCIDNRNKPGHPVEQAKNALQHPGQHMSEQEKQMLSSG